MDTSLTEENAEESKPHSASQPVTTDYEDIEKPAPVDVKWLNFVRRHVMLAREIVHKTFFGRTLRESQSILLEYLDGYLTWLRERPRKKMLIEIISKTTFPTTDLSKKQLAGLNSSFLPSSEEEAKNNLYHYLILWRALFSIVESLSFCANRLAQIYDWELTNTGPLYELCKNPDSNDILFTESDITEFYQDGIRTIEKRKVNFDDVNESANFRIKEKKPLASTPRMKNWARKTFKEPEGVCAFVVALRNYFSIMFFNGYLTLAAWAWFRPDEIEVPVVLLCDGFGCVVGAMLELISRCTVYPCRILCSCSMPIPLTLIQIVIYLIGAGEVGLWFLISKLKIFDPSAAKMISLAAIGGSILLRALHNMILFLRFPALAEAHHKRTHTTCGGKNRMLIKTFIFFFISTGILVPLNYWFAVPTLQRSAFWNFCSALNLVTKVQCHIGIIGLWVPLLSIILIMNFISYACILSFYGAYLARSKKIGYRNDEAFSVVAGFRSFASLLSKWKVEVPFKTDDSMGSEVLENNFPLYTNQEDLQKKSKTDIMRSAYMSVMDVKQVEDQMESVYTIWYLIVDDLLDMDYINEEAAKHLYVAFNWQDIDLASKPKEIIQFFFSSIMSLSRYELESLAEQTNFLEKLPSLTQLIPSYGETVVFDNSYLCNRDKKDITNMEFLVLKYAKEWNNFHARMMRWFSKDTRIVPSTPHELLATFLNGVFQSSVNPPLDPTLNQEIRLWASLRGQTLYKTIRGAVSYRIALRGIYQVTQRGQAMAPYRSQVILAHQQYGDPSVLKVIAKDIRLVYKRLSTPRILGEERYGDSPFDLVFDWSPKDLATQKAFMIKLAQQQNEEAIKRYTLKSIHHELEDVCAYGDTLKRLIDCKSGDVQIGPKNAFPYASVLAGLPTPFRIRGNVWLFKYRGMASDEFHMPSENDENIDNQDDEENNNDLGNDSDENSDDPFNDTNKSINSKTETFKWSHLATGSAVVHCQVPTGECAWLRVFHYETGREFEYIIRNHMFEVKPISIYEVPNSAMSKHASKIQNMNYYAVIKFGVKNDTRTEVFALVASLSNNPSVVKSNSCQLIGKELPNDKQPNLITEKNTKEFLETIAMKRALTHPRKYVKTSFSEIVLQNYVSDHNRVYKSMMKVLDIFDDFSEQDCLGPKTVPVKSDGIHLGIEVIKVLPRYHPLILRVSGELPFNEADRIQGKASNQMNGLRFAFGLVIQTKDANQGGNIAEALKFPIILSRFGIHRPRSETQKKPLNPAIIGFRETIFTLGHGSVARYQAYAEWAFVTIVQRVFSKLGIRMHYGHPDFFDAAWVFSRSSISKANPIYNLSEDIFAGYVALLTNRRSIHTDEIQDEKGRDTSLASTYTFTAKLAQGAASQMKTRDVFNMNTRLDFIRQYLLFHSSLGYYFITTAMLISVKMYLFGLLVFAFAGYSAENIGNLEFIYSVPFLVQVGMFTLLPLVLEIAVEEGFWEVMKIITDLPLSLGYFLFQAQTTSHHLVESFIQGKSYYEATGRLLGVSRKPLVEVYQLYGRSHFEPALDYLFYVIVYYITTSTRHGGYLPLFAPIICIIVFMIGPSIYQVAHSLKDLFNDVGRFGKWIFHSESFSILLKEWKSGPLREQVIKNMTWKATFRPTHTRLQTYSIFNSLKGIINTHWRVDLGNAFSCLFRIIIWLFIILSIPGTMKDGVLKILIGSLLYIVISISISATNSHQKRGCWSKFTNVLFVFAVAYFLSLLIALQVWRYLGFAMIGLFLSLKVMKPLAWLIFHLYAWRCKVSATKRWHHLDRKVEAKKILSEERDKLVKGIKANLERSFLSGLYLVDCVNRPFILLSLLCVFIPVHIIFNIFWSISHISHILMYSVVLKSPQNRRSNAMHPQFGSWGAAGAYNSIATSPEMDELPEFDFEDDAEVM